MIVFAYVGIFAMPVIGYLFVLFLLRAIQRIVKNKRYTVELFWSGLFFALIVWTIALLLIFPVN
ncbi:hypothetical protein DFQ01_13024 [Paenibacillus cellulosilyticus]|uniref:Uncharacterized protein n=1 Tax=Paenibacillus cellulosilyticus TaxID=375489 RepID=A0A2V2YLF7_9BACL|nr:hypothetical protein DFQ01_13024 [Paenibacillus cellulosilyticus]